MILAIDIGGTKTLIALCNEHGQILQTQKFATPSKYSDFKAELASNFSLIKQDYHIVVVAAPGKINRQTLSVEAFGNLTWKNTPIADDLSKLTGKKVLIENDANLAGLYASHTQKPLPHKSLYITVSTGIGTGIVTDGYLDPDFLDSEGGNILLEHNNKLVLWEKFASGKAIVEQYGQKASEINDPKIWDKIAYNLALGMIDLIAVLDPDVILIGGGVGSHFDKYAKQLNEHLSQLKPRLIEIPKIVATPNAEEAVIYGCVILANQHDQAK
jgi:glucokinase